MNKTRIPAWAQVARTINQHADRHWFDDDTLRFFGTRFHGEPDRHGIFVTSERNFDGTAREFRVRRLINGGETVKTLTEFDDIHGTLDSARREARQWRAWFTATAEVTK